MAPLDARYVTVKWWDEGAFCYQETVINLGRSELTYAEVEDLHNPPLVYVGEERVL